MSYRLTVLIVLALGTGLPGLAGDLSLPSGVVLEKGSATLSLTLSAGGEKLTALQCDFDFDAEALRITAEVSSAATGAGKTLYVSPVVPGRWRLLLAGINQTTIQDGAVVLLKIEMGAGARPGTEYPIHISKAAGTTGQATVVPLSGKDGSVVRGYN